MIIILILLPKRQRFLIGPFLLFTKSVELSKSSNTNTNKFTDSVSRKSKRNCTQRQVVDVTTVGDVQQISENHLDIETVFERSL